MNLKQKMLMHISLPQSRPTCRCSIKLVISSGVSRCPGLWQSVSTSLGDTLGKISGSVVPNPGCTAESPWNSKRMLSRLWLSMELVEQECPEENTWESFLHFAVGKDYLHRTQAEKRPIHSALKLKTRLLKDTLQSGKATHTVWEVIDIIIYIEEQSDRFLAAVAILPPEGGSCSEDRKGKVQSQKSHAIFRTFNQGLPTGSLTHGIFAYMSPQMPVFI